MSHDPFLKNTKKNKMKNKERHQKSGNIWKELRSSWLRTLVGFILFVFAITVISNNEFAAIETTKAFSMVFKDLRIVTNINQIDPSNEGALLYITGQIYVDEPLTEPEYGVSVPSVNLKRRVQMYQWAEEKQDLTEEVAENNVRSYPTRPNQYSYKTDWRDKLIESNKFHDKKGHRNPEKLPISSNLYVSSVVRIGSYILSDEIKKKFNDFILITSDERPERKDIKLHAGLYYHSNDVWKPQVGDIRVQFTFAGMSGDTVSIIAKQAGNEIGKEGCVIFSKGKVLPDHMVKEEHSGDVWSIRFYRSLGWICLYSAASFLSVILKHCSKKYILVYNFLILDGIISPNIAFASITFTLVIFRVWHWYERSTGISIIIAFSLPWFIFAVVKKSKKWLNGINEMKKGSNLKSL